MGIFTEREGDFAYPPNHRLGKYHTGGVVGPARDFAPAREGARDTHCYHLRGLHNHSGNWVTLLRFEDAEESKQALRKCNGSEQPDLTQTVIKWDHFSAYKIESMVTVTWMRDP